MGAVPVVAVQPDGQLSLALEGVFVSHRIGPFSQGCLDEAFGFSLGLWRIGTGEDLAQAEGF